MTDTRLMGQSLSERGGVSLYLRIPAEWMRDRSVEDTFRLGIEDTEGRGVRLRLYCDDDYSDAGIEAPGGWDVSPVDITTITEFCVPAGIRKEHELTGSDSYNAEYVGGGEAVYDIVPATSARQPLTAD